MGWFSSKAAPEDKEAAGMLDWAIDKLRQKKKRDAEKAEQERQMAEDAVRKALNEDEDK